jgi:hypothetical protein
MPSRSANEQRFVDPRLCHPDLRYIHLPEMLRFDDGPICPNEPQPTKSFDSTVKAGAMVRRLGEMVLNDARELRAKYEGFLRDLG